MAAVGGTSFLDLPGELRNQVYKNIFDPLVEGLKHPWDPHPSNDRFDHVCDLFRTNKQIYEEAGPLFGKSYCDRVVLYYDRSTDLIQDYQRKWNKCSLIFAQVRFSLRQFGPLNESPTELEERMKTEVFWECQPGFRSQWLFEAPRSKYYTTAWNKVDINRPGFKLTTGKHTSCSDPDGCVTFYSVKWPTFDNGCQLMTHVASTEGPRTTPVPGVTRGNPPKLRCMVLEGRLRSIEDPYHAANHGTLAMYVASVKLPEGWIPSPRRRALTWYNFVSTWYREPTPRT